MSGRILCGVVEARTCLVPFREVTQICANTTTTHAHSEWQLNRAILHHTLSSSCTPGYCCWTMTDTLPLISPNRDEFRNRAITESGGSSGGSRAVSPRATAELPVEAIGIDEDVTHNYYFCVSEKKYVSMTVALVVLTVLFYLSKQGITMYMTSLLSWVKSIGIWGNLMFVVLFLLVCMQRCARVKSV